jgi:hypothetical protein
MCSWRWQKSLPESDYGEEKGVGASLPLQHPFSLKYHCFFHFIFKNINIVIKKIQKHLDFT